MPRIDDILATLRADGRKALMPFVCGGHPGPGATGPILTALDRAGASVIEVGIPFSDPIADGATIAAAMHGALAAGATPASVMSEVRTVRGQIGCGLMAMVSMSIVHRCGGPAGFAAAAGEAGFDGILVPDLPLEESAGMAKAAAERGLSFPMLIAPSTPLNRAEAIVRMSSGFVYLLARAGITGEREGVPDVSGRVAKLRQLTSLPIAVGFGISNAEQVRGIVRHADAAIVGSALVRRIGEGAARGEEPSAVAGTFVRELMGGLTG